MKLINFCSSHKLYYKTVRQSVSPVSNLASQSVNQSVSWYESYSVSKQDSLSISQSVSQSVSQRVHDNQSLSLSSQILNYSAIQLVSKLASPGFILEHSLAGNRSAIILVSQ